jgi:hypothetical protein
MDTREEFQKIWDRFDAELRRKSFILAKPFSGEWQVHGNPWVREQGKYQIWVYMVPQWEQEQVWGTTKGYHSIYMHIQKGKILSKYEFKPRSVAALAEVLPKALEKIEDMIEQLDIGLIKARSSSQDLL